MNLKFWKKKKVVKDAEVVIEDTEPTMPASTIPTPVPAPEPDPRHTGQNWTITLIDGEVLEILACHTNWDRNEWVRFMDENKNDFITIMRREIKYIEETPAFIFDDGDVCAVKRSNVQPYSPTARRNRVSEVE